MIKKKIIIGVICLALSIAIGFGQYVYLSGEFTEESVQVLVAKRDIEVGQELKDEDFSLTEIPAGAYTKEMVAGIGGGSHYSLTKIPKGSYLLSNMTAERPAPLLKDGQVKVTIRVDLYSALAGKILPGDQVSIGFVPGVNDASKAYVSGMVAKDLTIADVTNEKGKDINSSKSGNAYAADEVILPAAVTLICENEKQSIALKEYEKAGSLFLTMAGGGEVS